MILESNSFLGFNIYKRIRLHEQKIDFEKEIIHCDDIGLFVIGEYPDLEYNYVSLSQKKEWYTIALKTINLTILNLIVSNTISLHKYEDERRYLNGLIKYRNIDYFFKIEDISEQEDLLTKAIILTINKLYEENPKIITLKSIIKRTVDLYLYKSTEHRRPAKKFVIALLKQYSKKYDWLKIVETEKLLGIYRDYKVDVNRIYIPRIKMQHKNLKAYHITTTKKSIDYKNFVRHLDDVLVRDFRNREPQKD